MFIAGDLELARAVVLYPNLDPVGPGVQLLEEGSGSVPIQYDNVNCMRKSVLWLQEMRDDGSA